MTVYICYDKSGLSEHVRIFHIMDFQKACCQIKLRNILRVLAYFVVREKQGIAMEVDLHWILKMRLILITQNHRFQQSKSEKSLYCP